MTTGDGIFWAGLFYFCIQLLGYAFAYATGMYPNRHVQRLDRIEKALAEMGVELEGG